MSWLKEVDYEEVVTEYPNGDGTIGQSVGYYIQPDDPAHTRIPLAVRELAYEVWKVTLDGNGNFKGGPRPTDRRRLTPLTPRQMQVFQHMVFTDVDTANEAAACGDWNAVAQLIRPRRADFSEVARTLGVTESTVRTTFSRACRALGVSSRLLPGVLVEALAGQVKDEFLERFEDIQLPREDQEEIPRRTTNGHRAVARVVNVSTVLENEGLIRRIADPLYLRTARSCTRGEWLQQARAAWMEAEHLYDPTRGTKLTTYCANRVRYELLAVIREQHGHIGSLRDFGYWMARVRRVYDAMPGQRADITTDELRKAVVEKYGNLRAGY